MIMNEIVLDTKLVGDITGIFFVPSYQRGYRWGKEEVERLLEDIYSNGSQGYCLQPIVVRKCGEEYELIDGQQRLTTLYLIYYYIYKISGGFLMKPPKFSLRYETREKSEDFLKNIDVSKKEENIDYWFICEAYQAISEWFDLKGEDKSIPVTEFNTYLGKNVEVIWYEVDESEDAIALFARLNIGKIPLTSAELVKAMFLSRHDREMTKERQEEISLQWDHIEKELHDESLWYFLTNADVSRYQTRVDLILDLMTKKTEKNRESYYTFFKFDEMKKEKSLLEIWNSNFALE